MGQETYNSIHRQIKAISARLMSGKVGNPYALKNKLQSLKNRLREQSNLKVWNDHLSR